MWCRVIARAGVQRGVLNYLSRWSREMRRSKCCFRSGWGLEEQCGLTTSRGQSCQWEFRIFSNRRKKSPEWSDAKDLQRSVCDSRIEVVVGLWKGESCVKVRTVRLGSLDLINQSTLLSGETTWLRRLVRQVVLQIALRLQDADFQFECNH